MQLIDCKKGRMPGAVYIGRQVANAYARSPLANPFKLGTDPTSLDGIASARSRAELLEKFRRHLTYDLAHGYPQPLAALRELSRLSTLACWCVERPARLTLGPITTEDGCHGDVIFTAWTGCERLGWSWRLGSRLHDFENFTAIHAELYQALFAHPLTWKNER